MRPAIARLIRRIRALVWRGQSERELADELRMHIDFEARELERGGHPTDEARGIAELAFGNAELVKDEARDQRGVRYVEDLLRDARFAWRTLARSRGFTAVAAMTIALGVGAVTTVFGALYGVVLAPLPYRDSGRIVTISQTDQRGGPLGPISAPNVLDLRQRSSAFAEIALIEQYGMVYTTPEGPDRLPAWQVSEGFFDALGVPALVGRTFTPDEFQPGRNAVVVIDYELWRSRFGADRSLVGRDLTLDGRPHTVVGVMPRGFRYPTPPGIWVPKVFSPAELLQRDAAFDQVIARLRDGVSIGAAAADAERVASQLRIEYPRSNRDASFRVTLLRDALVGPTRERLVVVMAAAALLLVIACANVLGLMLARMIARERELAVRVTLGAGSGRLVRQLLVESLVLAAVGGGGGILLAWSGLNVLRGWSAAVLPRAGVVSLSPAVLGFSVAATCASAVLFGIAPALSAARGAARTAEFRLRGASVSRSRRRAHDALVMAEMAIAMVLLSGAALLGHSLVDLYAVPRGFRSSNVAEVTVFSFFAHPTAPARVAYVRAAEAALAALPGVERVGMTTSLPFGGTVDDDKATVEIIGHPETSGSSAPTVHAAAVTPGYFDAMGIPLRAGRPFGEPDDIKRAPVAIVNQALVRAHFGSEDPLGKRMRVVFGSDSVEREIVGVVADVRDVSFYQPPRPTLFIPHAQSGSGANNFVIRTKAGARSMLPSIRRAMTGVSSTLPVAWSTSLDALVSSSVEDRRVVLLIVGVFAAAALGLAVFGIYGLMSRVTAERTRELGIRIAMGARPEDLYRLVVGRGLVLALAGTAVGLVGALAAGRAISGMLYGVGAADGWALSLGGGLVACSALAATWLPARRVARLEVVAALRESEAN
jgi:putative ABC transport system permease protein